MRADDVARELGVSRSRAYEVMREMPRLMVGRSVRVGQVAVLS